MGPKIGIFGGGPPRANPAGALLKALVFKTAPRWLKVASRSPRKPLENLLGSLHAVLESLWTLKNLEKSNVFEGFWCCRFWVLRGLDGPLGPILAPLGPISSQNGSQNGFPDGSKSTQDGLSWRTRVTGSACRSYLKSFCF